MAHTHAASYLAFFSQRAWEQLRRLRMEQVLQSQVRIGGWGYWSFQVDKLTVERMDNGFVSKINLIWKMFFFGKSLWHGNLLVPKSVSRVDLFGSCSPQSLLGPRGVTAMATRDLSTIGRWWAWSGTKTISLLPVAPKKDLSKVLRCLARYL